jgi:hypothetical protein
MCWGNNGSLRIAQDASGDTFFNSLESEYKKIMQRKSRELNRDADWIRLASQRDISGETCLVYLTELKLEHSWEQAVDWMNDARKDSSCRIYAVFETDEG